MKAIDGNVPCNDTYNLVDVYYGSLESGGYCCDNCGNLIANIATVKSNTTGKQYNIGLDCAETILTYNSAYAWYQIKELQKEHNRKLRFIRELKKSVVIVFSEEKNNDTFWTYDKPVTRWESTWKLRGNYSEHKDIIDNLGILKLTH